MTTGTAPHAVTRDNAPEREITRLMSAHHMSRDAAVAARQRKLSVDRHANFKALSKEEQKRQVRQAIDSGDVVWTDWYASEWMIF